MCLGLLDQGSGEGLLTNPVRFNFPYKLSPPNAAPLENSLGVLETSD
jgi:hypothetical protein